MTPPRWKEFDAELEAAWERIVTAMLSGDKHSIATAIMCYAYYWCVLLSGTVLCCTSCTHGTVVLGRTHQGKFIVESMCTANSLLTNHATQTTTTLPTVGTTVHALGSRHSSCRLHQGKY